MRTGSPGFDAYDDAMSNRVGMLIEFILSGRHQPRWSRRVQIALVIVVSVAIGVASVLAWRSLPGDGPIQWRWIVGPAVVLVPATLGLNAAEYRLAGALGGVRVSTREAVRISVLSTAANLMPVPGAVLVRMQGLRNKGVGTVAAARWSVTMGVAWLSVSLLAVGLLLVSAEPGYAVLLIGGGLVGVTFVARLIARGRSVSEAVRLGGAVALIQVAGAGQQALRMYLAFEAIGVQTGFVDAAAVSLSGVLASAVGVMPAGLGLSEALAAAIGQVLGVGASQSLVATTLVRFAGLAAAIPLALVLLSAPVKSERQEEPSHDI